MSESSLWLLSGAFVVVFHIGILILIWARHYQQVQQQEEIDKAYRAYPSAPSDFDFHMPNVIVDVLKIVAFIVLAVIVFLWLWLSGYGTGMIVTGMALYVFLWVIFIN